MNTKQLADLVTFGRAGGALAVAAWGTAGPKTVPWAAAFLLANWTGDILDGALARRSPLAKRTWIGDHDLEVDMWVAACMLAYLVLSGLVHWGLAAAYAIGSVVILVATRWPRSLDMLFQAPIYAGFILIAIDQAPWVAQWLVLWPLVAILITWPKFPKVVVPGFLAGMKEIWHNSPGSHPKV